MMLQYWITAGRSGTPGRFDILRYICYRLVLLSRFLLPGPFWLGIIGLSFNQVCIGLLSGLQCPGFGWPTRFRGFLGFSPWEEGSSPFIFTGVVEFFGFVHIFGACSVSFTCGVVVHLWARASLGPGFAPTLGALVFRCPPSPLAIGEGVYTTTGGGPPFSCLCGGVFPPNKERPFLGAGELFTIFF